jgi:predicted glycosyltransferase involved in capsule biosynthesis
MTTKEELNALEKLFSNVAIIIPYSGDKDREEGFRHVVHWYKKNFPKIKIYIGKSMHSPFNISASRNLATNNALADGKTIFYHADADTIVARENFIKTILYVDKNKTVCFPHDTVVICPKKIINKIFDEDFKKILKENKNGIFFIEYNNENITIKNNIIDQFWSKYDIVFPCAAPFAISKNLLLKVGNFDENFVGYGAEDGEYYSRIKKHTKHEPKKLHGIAVSINHERDYSNLEDNRTYAKQKIEEGLNSE